MKRSSIATKLTLLFAVTVLVAVSVGIVGLWTQSAARRVGDEMRQAYVGQAHVERINGLVYAVVMDSRGVYMTEEPKKLEKFAKGMAENLDRMTREIGEWKIDIAPELRHRFETLEARVAQFREFRLELARLGREVGYKAARDYGDNEANRSVRIALNKDLEALAEGLSAQAAAATAERDRLADRARLLVASLLVVAVVVGLFGFLRVRSQVTGPITTLVATMKEISGGRTAVAVPFRARADEIGSIAGAVVAFRDTAERSEAMKDDPSAEGRARAERRARIDAAIVAFETEVGALTGELGRAVETLSGAARDQIRVTVAAAAEEPSASVDEIDGRVTEATATARAAVETAERSSAALRSLAGSARRIGDVVDLIRSIAEQTNLLALDAALAAVRAGDGGHGFAVVADEVAALADRTAEATEEISARIVEMQSTTRTSVEAIETILTTIRTIDAITMSADAALAQQSTSTSEVICDIPHATAAIREVDGDIREVDAAMSETSRAAEGLPILDDVLDRRPSELDTRVEFLPRTIAAA